MPAGTTVSFTSTNGNIITNPASFTVPNTNQANPSALDGVGKFSIRIESDAQQTSATDANTSQTTYTCSNVRATGDLTVTVKTPSGKTTTSSIVVND
jgi:hypothetical protein